MSTFVNEMSKMVDMSLTTNGGKSYSTTSSDLLDMFGALSSFRKSSEKDIIDKWEDARNEDMELANNLILYARSVRNGLGERRTGRILLRNLAKVEPQKVIRNFQKIVDTGRWDDLFVFEGTPVEHEMWMFIREQLEKDLIGMRENKPISLCAKWLKSINTSSAESRRIAKKTCNKLGLTERTYRKMLAALRKHIDVVERKMAAREWDSINFETVPSVAMNRYIRAFDRNCGDSFKEYKEKLKTGEAKVNAAALYPYDIIQKGFPYALFDDVLEAQWNNLPNYLENSKDEVLFVIDTSGSMACDGYKPISTAVGLGLYFAQRNSGTFHNMFLTFSQHPEICKIKDGWNLQHCVDYILERDWGSTTNLDKTFELIYDIAAKAKSAPKALCIVSDMQINYWDSQNTYNSITEKWQKKFEEIGLTAPKLIYWNVCSNTYLAKPEDKVSFVSGYGLAPFKDLTTLIEKNAYTAMCEILTKKEFCWD